MTESQTDPHNVLDHLVYGVTDLLGAVDEIERCTGVRPAEGGRHTGRGTRNYLLAFSPTSYLEVIGMDADNPPAPDVQVPFHLDQLTSDRLVTWAVHPADIDGTIVTCRRHGIDFGKLMAMSRHDDAGNELTWHMAISYAFPFDGLAPFLIDWGHTPHPGSSGIPTVTLESLSLQHPEPTKVNALMTDLRLPAIVTEGPASFYATISGPAGSLRL